MYVKTGNVLHRHMSHLMLLLDYDDTSLHLLRSSKGIGGFRIRPGRACVRLIFSEQTLYYMT